MNIYTSALPLLLKLLYTNRMKWLFLFMRSQGELFFLTTLNLKWAFFSPLKSHTHHKAQFGWLAYQMNLACLLADNQQEHKSIPLGAAGSWKKLHPMSSQAPSQMFLHAAIISYQDKTCIRCHEWAERGHETYNACNLGQKDSSHLLGLWFFISFLWNTWRDYTMFAWNGFHRK